MPDMVEHRLNESHPRLGAPLSSLYMRLPRARPIESLSHSMWTPCPEHGGFFVILPTPV